MIQLGIESIVIITSAILFFSTLIFIALFLIWHRKKTKKMLGYRESLDYYNVQKIK